MVAIEKQHNNSSLFVSPQTTLINDNFYVFFLRTLYAGPRYIRFKSTEYAMTKKNNPPRKKISKRSAERHETI